MNELDIFIGEQIRVEARRKKMSLRQLCKQTGIVESSMHIWLKRGSFSISHLQKIAQVLDIDLLYLISGRNELKMKTEYPKELNEVIKKISQDMEIIKQSINKIFRL